MFADGTMAALEVALSGVAERQRVAAHNIANLNTPGFRSSRVVFEDDLARALRRDDRLDRSLVGHVQAGTPVNIKDNDVALEEESQTLITAGLQFDALVSAYNYKIGALRTALT